MPELLLKYKSDNLVKYVGKDERTGAPLNAGDVRVTAVVDESGATVAGATPPYVMAYVPGSAGKWLGVLPAALFGRLNAVLTLKYTATTADGKVTYDEARSRVVLGGNA